MPTAPPLFTDGVTALNALVFNKLMAQDAVATASARLLATYLAAADANPAFQVNGDGKHLWGPGGASATDTALYRAFAGVLGTDGALNARSGTTAQVQIGTGSSVAGLGFGSTSDTNLYRAAQAVLKTDGAIATASYGTSLPASPVDGQEYTLVDSTTAPTYQWRFRYNASNSTAYKWEYVGGSAAHAFIGTNESTTNAAFGDLATVGPLLAIARAGIYDAQCGATAWNTTANLYAQMCLAAGATAPSSGAQGNYQSPAASSQGVIVAAYRMTVAAGGDIRARYSQGGSGGTASFFWRWLRVTPVCVA